MDHPFLNEISPFYKHKTESLIIKVDNEKAK